MHTLRGNVCSAVIQKLEQKKKKQSPNGNVIGIDYQAMT